MEREKRMKKFMKSRLLELGDLAQRLQFEVETAKYKSLRVEQKQKKESP
jgi:hypothetical protein